jgi:methyl-accepting chemotaxis protein
MDTHTETLLTIFVGLTGVAVLLQACVLLGIYIALKKAANSIKAVTEVADDLKGTVVPLVHTTRELLERITPQIMTISTGLAELTDLVHRQGKGVSTSAAEIMERVNRQTARLDAMLTNGLDKVEETAAAVETVVAKPVRQVNGIIAGIRAAVERYVSDTRSHPSSRRRVVYPNADSDFGLDPDADIIE